MLDIHAKYVSGEITGWRKDEEHMKALAQSCRHPYFAAAAPDVMDLPPRDTFLWRPFLQTLRMFYKNENYQWHPQHQVRGTCGGQGTKLGHDTVAGVMTALYDLAFPGRFSVAGIYAFARVEVARQPGNWDGCAGSWLAEASMKGGCLLLSDIGLDNEDKDNDEQLAVQWAASRDGVPQKFQDLQARRLIEDAPRNTTVEEVGKGIQNGNPSIVGCTLIPTGKRDSRGISHVQRASGHLTLFWGVQWNGNKVASLLYQNSWPENWASGPVYPDDMPPGSVWLPADECQSMIDEGDCYQLCGIGGLAPRVAMANA